jgi:dUTP pyrophosphatase
MKFRVKLLTNTAKKPTRENPGDLWDLYVDNFCVNFLKDTNIPPIDSDEYILKTGSRILIKTGIALELPIFDKDRQEWTFYEVKEQNIQKFAVADIRPRSGLALKYGITITNSPGTIDNKYRKEIGIILHNLGHQDYKITKGDKIAQMLVRSLDIFELEMIDDLKDTGRGGFGSTGK